MLIRYHQYVTYILALIKISHIINLVRWADFVDCDGSMRGFGMIVGEFGMYISNLSKRSAIKLVTKMNREKG